MMPQAPPQSRPSSTLFAIIAIVLLLVGAFVGYLLGSSGIHQAVLRASVENRTANDLSVQLLVNGKPKQTVTVPSGQVVVSDIVVSFTPSDGAIFEVKAVGQQGINDSERVLVASSGTYVVELRLG